MRLLKALRRPRHCTTRDLNQMAMTAGITVQQEGESVVVTRRGAFRTSTRRFAPNPDGTWHAVSH